MSMSYYVGCDAHKKFSQIAVLDETGQLRDEAKVMHTRSAIRDYFTRFPEGTQVALETVGNWYWIADEIEAAGCEPLLAHAAKAKLMMGHTNKTDKLDAKGLATLLRNGTLPQVWLPPGELRDERELPRTRMALCKVRTALKNRVQSTLAKYAITIDEVSDIFGRKGRGLLAQVIQKLPPETRRCLEQHLEVLDEVQEQIDQLEARMKERIQVTEKMKLLKTLPGVGDILAMVIEREMGCIDRFPDNERFASYCGTTPKVKASGGKVRYGRMRQDVNRYLKWAFIEAANVVVRHQNRRGWQQRHVTRLYKRIRNRRGPAIAVGAVARHLAEAAYWVLKKGERYKEPKAKGNTGSGSVLPKPG